MLAACAAFIGLRETPLFLIAVSFAGLFVAVAMLVTRRVTAARLKHLFRCVFDWRYDRAEGRKNLPNREVWKSYNSWRGTTKGFANYNKVRKIDKYYNDMFVWKEGKDE